jgi:hypothetical protein
VTMPPNPPPRVLPLKRLNDLLELFLLFPFLPIIIIRVRGVSGLCGGGRGSGSLGLRVLGGWGNRGSGGLFSFLASFSLNKRKEDLANTTRRSLALALALFSRFRFAHCLSRG